MLACARAAHTWSRSRCRRRTRNRCFHKDIAAKYRRGGQPIVSAFDLFLSRAFSNVRTVPHAKSHTAAPSRTGASAQTVALLLLGLLIAAWPVTAKTAATGDDLVRAELVAEPKVASSGQPFWVGVHLRIKDHWHVYWR